MRRPWSGPVWCYTPEHHKSEHHGRPRVILIGPQAQAILLPYLLRDAEAYCFSPAESEHRRKAELRARRQTKVQPSQRDRSHRNPKRKPSEKYSARAYLTAVRRGCERAFPIPPGVSQQEQKVWRQKQWWSPNQLRHSVATQIRQQFGLEAAQVVLGHSRADVTQVYAERDLQKAAGIMQQIG